MKVIALGGSGNMGQVAVRTLLESTLIDEIIVADLDIERARVFVRENGDPRLRAEAVDIGGGVALADLFSRGDAIANSTGPFYRYGIPVLRAAIAAGKHYADICDDYRPTAEALELDREAKAAGITAIIGMGASPGITNILARHAASQLDEVESIQTVWGTVGGQLRRPRSDWSQVERTAAAVVHFLYCASGMVPTFRDGKWVEIKPLAEGEEVSFPNGKGVFYHIGHPEPVTLPRYIRGVKNVNNLCGEPPEGYDVLRELAARMDAEEITVEQAAASYVPELYKKMLRRPESPVDHGPLVGGLWASATGLKNGKRMRFSYGPKGYPPGGMAGVTGVPHALGLGMILDGTIKKRGVFAPEGIIDPMEFFRRYREYWNQPFGDGGPLVEWIEDLI